jgi:hypothetical protein
MCRQIRVWGRKVQAKYEGMLASNNLYGFSKLYTKTMEKLKEHEQEAS